MYVQVAEAQARLEHNKRYVAFLQHQIDIKEARAARQKAQENEVAQDAPENQGAPENLVQNDGGFMHCSPSVMMDDECFFITHACGWLSVLITTMHHCVQDDASRRYMIQEDDETFQKYADVCIEEWRRQGKETKPMKLYMDTLEKYGNSVTRRV